MADKQLLPRKPLIVKAPPKEGTFNVEREEKPGILSRFLNPIANPKDEYGNPLNIDEEGRKIETVAPSFGNEFTALASKIPFDKLRNFLTDKIATSDVIPEKVRPYAAGAASLATEIPRLMAEAPPFPKGIPKSDIKVPEVVEAPKVVQKSIPKALPAAGETTRKTPRFIGGQAGLVDADNVPKIDLGPTTEFQRETTILPHEFGERTSVTPDIAANYGGTLGRPANIIPEEMHSTGSPQAIEPLIPNRYKTVPESLIYNDGNVTRVPTRPRIVKQTPVPQTELDAVKSAKTQRLNKLWDDKGVKQVATSPNIPSEIRSAVVQMEKEESSKPPSSVLQSIYTQLERIGGKELVQKSQRAVHQIRALDATFTRPLINVGKQLSKDVRDNFGLYVEGKIAPPTPEVANAVKIWKEVQNGLATEAEKVGVRLYDGDNFEPFTKMAGDYWPHVPTEKKGDFINKLVEQGKTVNQATKIYENMRTNGEIVHGFQNIRKDAKFDYRVDFDTAIAHMRGMAKRIGHHVELGPLDINGTGEEGIADILHATKDPKLANKLMQRIIGRDEFSVPKLNKILNFSKKYSALTKLGNFTIPNIELGQMANIYKGASHPIEVASELKNLFSKTYRDDLRAAGLFEDVAYTLGEDFSSAKGFLHDPFAIGAGETFNRMVAGSVGKAVARGHFNAIKSGNPGFRNEFGKELSDLLSADLDDILKQDKLTPKQLQQAAARMAEITQGLNVPGNLPHGASDPLITTKELGVQLMWIFKKIGFQNTKMLWTAVKRNPVRNVPLLIGLSQSFGPLIGGTKSAIKGAVSGKGPMKEWEKRDDWVMKAIGKHELSTISNATGIPEWMITRGLDNIAQSFMLGLPADLFNSASQGPAGGLESLAGPVISDASELAL
jgi:hypothetical protein